jgi:hypothetical protein
MTSNVWIEIKVKIDDGFQMEKLGDSRIFLVCVDRRILFIDRWRSTGFDAHGDLMKFSWKIETF